ncbi:MAG: histidine phosphatase family protein [Bryobacteraceae bacterium]|nr:histidine phosphatase family protein [Bryobacteraceae bacterium]
MIHLIRHARPPVARQRIAPSPIAPASIFCSPLERAVDTANLLFPGHKIRILPELAEIGMGEWEGKTWEEIEARWPGLAKAKLDDWTAAPAPGGEAWSDFEARVRTAWRILIAAPSPVAVVAHAGVNSVLRQFATGQDPTTFSQDYCEVISLEFE